MCKNIIPAETEFTQMFLHSMFPVENLAQMYWIPCLTHQPQCASSTLILPIDQGSEILSLGISEYLVIEWAQDIHDRFHIRLWDDSLILDHRSLDLKILVPFLINDPDCDLWHERYAFIEFINWLGRRNHHSSSLSIWFHIQQNSNIQSASQVLILQYVANNCISAIRCNCTSKRWGWHLSVRECPVE